MNLPTFQKLMSDLPNTPRMPVLFVGHGSPANALEDNPFTRAWKTVGQNLPRPNAILCISAHWFVDGTYVHGARAPKTIHDYYGFAPELYALSYPCPGAPDYARATMQTVKGFNVGWDLDWGLDHGCWVVIRHMFPNADVPVFQMSLDYTKGPEAHYALAAELGPLREKGVLIIGSGNIVHNLGLITFEENAKPFDWALEFDDTAKKYIADGNFAPLIHYKNLGHAAHESIPSPDHYWPMLYALALKQKGEEVTFFAEGISHSSISMRSFIIQ